MRLKLSFLESYRVESILQLSVIFLLALLTQGMLVGNVTLHTLLLIGLMSLVVGPSVGILEIYVYPTVEGKHSFPVVLLVKTAVNLLVVLLALTLMGAVARPWMAAQLAASAQAVGLEAQAREMPALFTNGPLFTKVVVSNLIICFWVTFVHQMIQKMGRRMFWHFVTGKYHQPKEEDRIFMFVDLKDSTTLAERLGNYRFSRLVSDFFTDLSEPVLETRGEIYQYVGDEVVITWLTGEGLRGANCVQCFLKMEQNIARRQDYYLHTYGIVPEFKAGLHCGMIVITQVGDLKREVVYHGDVINTAARIQEQCNALDQRLLLSETLALQFQEPGFFLPRFIGQVALKGKQKSTRLYSVDQTSRFLSRNAS